MHAPEVDAAVAAATTSSCGSKEARFGLPRCACQGVRSAPAPRKQHQRRPVPRPARAPGLALAALMGVLLAAAAHLNAATTVPTEDPEFTELIENITVPAGRNVKLACSVKHLGTYKVAWMHFEQSAILTVHNHVITRNPRITVTHDKHRTWFLHINNVQEEDKGRYMCQINTVTAKTQFGFLHVVVPPNIDDSLSSSDVIVREGANVTLTCNATGSPPPSVKWKRDDGSKIAINKSTSVLEWEGGVLEMTRISRLDMGAYLCIASNGVPPTVSKRIKVSVDFPPMLWIPHQLVGAPLGYNVTLECFTEAHPTSLNYWTRNDTNMIHESRKYRAENTVGSPSYKTHMKLTINNIQDRDYGTYKCVAKNPRGETDGTIRLYTSAPPTTTPGPTSTDLPRRNPDPLEGATEANNSVNNPNLFNGILAEKGKGTKYQSNLNEIDKSEQKSVFESSGKGVQYEWPQPDAGANGACGAGEGSVGAVAALALALWLATTAWAAATSLDTAPSTDTPPLPGR